MKKTLLMASVACACVLAASASYDPWFTGMDGATGTNAMGQANGTWVFNVTNGTASVNASSKLEFDLDDGETIVFNADQAAAPDTNTITRVAVTGVFTPVKSTDLPTQGEMNTRGAQVGFVVASTENETTTYNYKAWVGGDSWITLGSAIDAANIGAETALVVEFDYSHRTGNSNLVTFKTVTSGGATTNTLENGANVPMTSDAAANRCVAGMTCYGSGTLAAANGEVEIGYATLGVDGPKYASISEAVAASSGQDVVVVRPTSENVTVTKSGVTIVDNGIYSGTVTPSGENVTTTVKPATAEFTGASLAGASGDYTLNFKSSAANIDKVTVELPADLATKKEIVPNSKTVDGNGNVKVTLQTAKTVLVGATPDGGKAFDISTSEKEAALRTFLSTNAKTEYERADVSSSTIATALNGTPENKNGLKLWQDYALGITPEDSVKPVAAPAGDTETAYITLAIPDLVGKTPSGDYAISYKVGDTVQTGAGAIKIPLTGETVTGNKDVKVVFTP